jgi:hypothetical protein
MKLRELAKVGLGMRDADFWLPRVGDAANLGKPTDAFDPTHIGVKVTRTDILLPRFLYYVFVKLWMDGVFRDGVTVVQVKNLKFRN